MTGTSADFGPKYDVPRAVSSGSAAPVAKLSSRSQCGLEWPGCGQVGDAQLVARMGAERIVGHQLQGYLASQLGFEAAAHIDAGELVLLGFCLFCELDTLARQIGRFAIGLRADRNVFPRRHRHRARDQRRYACNQDGL